jgi:hypothetical protein
VGIALWHDAAAGPEGEVNRLLGTLTRIAAQKGENDEQ